MKKNNGRFRCTTCGDYFNLSKEETEDYENGYFQNQPDTCDDCSGCSFDGYEIYQDFSDADPGL